MRILFYLAAISFIAISCNKNEKQLDNTDKQELSQEQIEEDIWKAIDDRFAAWKENDLETFLAYYHPDWKRWASRENVLTTKDGITGFWNKMKAEEECLEMETTPICIRLSDDRSSAVAHYTHTEKFTYHGEDMPDGRTKGNTFKGTLRWSDFLVNENGKWLVIGGHRDMSMPEGKLVQVD
ncbi:MAG: nuclear transport factor 2 family protein [Flavobacteriales bacterium]|nr:nuclear transport factor 2 family protein [Flavobacteriales bacterium]